MTALLTTDDFEFTFSPASLSVQRDHATQAEFDDASLLAALPWLALSLVVSLGAVLVVEGIRKWTRQRR